MNASQLQTMLSVVLRLSAGASTGNTQMMTPRSLIELMLARIPEHVLNDASKTYLDPCCGKGTFLVCLFVKLMSTLEKSVPDVRMRAEHILTKQLHGWDMDEDQAMVTRKLLMKFASRFGVAEERLRVNSSDTLQYNADMRFDVIVGNPPYNGVAKPTASSFENAFATGYYSYYPFMMQSAQMLTSTGIMVMVTPNLWLSDAKGEAFRTALFELGKLAYVNVGAAPKEWTDNGVETGQVAVTVFERGRKKHAQSITVTADGKVPNVRSPLDVAILTKVTAKLKSHVALRFFNGNVGDRKARIDVVQPEREYIFARGVRCNGQIYVHDWMESEINGAVANGERFLLYPSFQRAPFKVTGKNEKLVKTPVLVVEPMPVCCAYVVLRTTTPDKHLKLLESNVAKFVWRMFFSDRHYAKTLSNVFPDIASLLPDAFSEADVYRVFDLTNEEITHVEQLALTYGKDM